MADQKPKESRLFYRITIGVIAFCVLAGGIYYFVNQNKSSANVATTNTFKGVFAINNFTETCKADFKKLSAGYRCDLIEVTVENAPADLDKAKVLADSILKKQIGDAIIKKEFGGYKNFATLEFCALVTKNVVEINANDVQSLVERGFIYDSIKNSCDTIDNAPGNAQVSKAYDDKLPDVTIKLATTAPVASAQPSADQISPTITATATVAEATSKINFKVDTKIINSGINQPVNSAIINAENVKKGVQICTTDKDGSCNLTKADLQKIIEQFKEPTDTNEDNKSKVNVLAYKAFKNQQSKSELQPLSVEKADYKFVLALDEAQANETINYVAQGMTGVESGLPTLGNNAITFSAKRESNKELVRVGGVSFELTGRVDKSAKAADTASTAAQAAKKALKDYDASGAKMSSGELSSGARISNFLSGGALKTIKGVIPDDGNESRVTVPNLPDGVYRLVVRKNLFESTTTDNIVLKDGVTADFDTLETGAKTANTIMIKPKANAEPPALPDGYTANKVPLSKDYMVASKGKYVANSTDNLYFSFIEPRPGWTNNIFVERQVDPSDPKDQKRLEKIVDDCIGKQSGMNMGFGANVNANTLKNLGFFNAAYQLFLNPNKNQSDQDNLMQAISGIGLTQILAKNRSSSYNVNIDLFDKCGINSSIIRNPSYNYSYGQQPSTNSGLNIGSLLGLLAGGRNATNNGTYYGDKLTLEYCRMINTTNTFVEDPRITQERMICQQRYGPQLILSTIGNVFGPNNDNPYANGYNSANTNLNKFVANKFSELRSCAGTKLFLTESPVVFDQNTAQHVIQVMDSEYRICSNDPTNYEPSAQWRDFNFLMGYGFIDSSGTRTNKLLSNAFRSFRSCAGNKISLSKAPTPNSQMAQKIFSIMVDEYERCTADRKDYTPGDEWTDVKFLSQMGFM